MPDLIDLHIHTDHSDGRQSPAEAVKIGIALDLKAIAITDHDAVSGVDEAVACDAGKEIEVISGIELSASKADDDIHILGYLFRTDDARLLEALDRFRKIRLERSKKMVERLSGLGIKIDYDEIVKLADKAPIGRPHVAEVMARHGVVSSYEEAFRDYLSLNGPVYVPKAKLTPREAIELIHNAEGVAVMAHPGLTNEDDLIEEMAYWGLDGIEIFHPTHKPAKRKRYRRLAERLGLFCTGGSDSHNRTGRYGNIGHEKVPYEYLTVMKSVWEKLRN
ncbi:MAG: PHP domain-containing protein [candidate division Zixibacteria bacterium]